MEQTLNALTGFAEGVKYQTNGATAEALEQLAIIVREGLKELHDAQQPVPAPEAVPA